MRPFDCPNCGRLNHFEVRVCPACSATLGYDPEADAFRFLADDRTTWRERGGRPADMMVCANNNRFGICNWLTTPGAPNGMCRACRHNRTIPDLADPAVPPLWARVEEAKRRLFHSLIRLGLPLETKAEERPGVQGLAFDFLYRPGSLQGGHKVVTGHDEGLITLDVSEADDAHRERVRQQMGEPYRTLLGHFRHEAGHHYWSRLVAPDPARLEQWRALFGDEREDYGAALAAHYNGGRKAWTEGYVSHYATSHPWEDFAETFAHYLHIVDTLATVRGFGLSLTAFGGVNGDGRVELGFDPYAADAAALAAEMAPVSFAMNAVNRAMGQSDLYPFNLTGAIVGKLAFVQDMARAARGG
ncbi:putative zinc-binding metallopeptidase [Novosphingobium flavum]|uniref:Putative zinc-binding metallopeptidase n=1 Tax=Novosphingobium flavum TaxID=1778672 RepID=A0A7X1FUM2_9SPHN|nr:putative zinc-binding metallopeptidase [Novosphingobium flavum]MBC2667263.1 putative zinc-binding metallopeptidase [Novosphingobium flavum]